MNTPLRVALKVPEAAAALGLGTRTFERHVLPHLRTIQVGSCRRVPVAELERWARESMR